MKLVDDAAEQATLEELLDTSKPPVPLDCCHLDYLLFTPFRYAARSDSRFRRAGISAGVFYAAEDIGTAVAEVSFWRLLFFIESPGLAWPNNPLEFTAFSVRYAANCLDLTRLPYSATPERWVHPTDYRDCHLIADEARRSGATAIRSVSARDPQGGCALALLTCAAFAEARPSQTRSWHVKLSANGIYARCEHPFHAMHFDQTAFARDPRVAGFNWQGR